MHYFSDRCGTFKFVLPILSAAAGQGLEHVLTVESPLAEIVDEVIRVHREPHWPDRIMVDERHRAFFKSVKLSLTRALAKVEQIEFVTIQDEDG